MKKEKEFNKLLPAFHKAVSGKSGNDFGVAIIKFAMENAFETPTQSILYRGDDGLILFITDSPFNDIGFVFGVFDETAYSAVGSKKQAKAYIKKLSEQSKDSSPN